MRPATKISSHNAALGDTGEPFSSPLLRELLEVIDSDRRHVILVPGPVNPGLLRFLQGRRCRLVVADAAVALSQVDTEDITPDLLADRLGRLVLDAGAEKIDAVLCWDLLNYMSPPLIKAFAARLTEVMTPSGRLHAYIHSANVQMSEFPLQYTVQGEYEVVSISSASQFRKTPRYSYGDLEKYASGMRVIRSVLLRNGIQEYMLQVRSD